MIYIENWRWQNRYITWLLKHVIYTKKLKVVRTCILLGFWIMIFKTVHLNIIKMASVCYSTQVSIWMCLLLNIHHSDINRNINWCLCRIEQQGILLKLASKTMYPYVIKMTWRYMDVMTFRTIFMLRWHDEMWCDCDEFNTKYPDAIQMAWRDVMWMVWPSILNSKM